MKKLVTITGWLILLGFVSQGLLAQQIDNQVKDHDIIQKVTQKTWLKALQRANHAKVNDQEVLEKITSQIAMDGNWINSMDRRFEYDGVLRTMASLFVWNESEWLPQYRSLFEYDGALMVSEIFQSYNISVSDYMNVDRFLLSYTDDGNQLLALITEQVWDGETWVDDYRTVVDYEQGVLSQVHIERWTGDDWIPTDRFIYEEEGGNTIETEQVWQEGDWVNSYRLIYHDITPTELIEVFMELMDEVEIELINLSLFLQFPDFIEQEWFDNDWQDYFRKLSETTFNSETGSKEQAIILFDYFEFDEWESEERFIVDYDDEERVDVISMQEPDFESPEWITTFMEEYFYDANGLTSQVLQSINPEMMKTMSQEEEFMPVRRHMFEWGSVATSIVSNPVPNEYRLDNAYPNPFNPTTVVPFYLEQSGPVTIRVYDILGRQVKTLTDGMYAAGEHRITFDATSLSSGIYMIRMAAGDFQQIRNVTLLK